MRSVNNRFQILQRANRLAMPTGCGRPRNHVSAPEAHSRGPAIAFLVGRRASVGCGGVGHEVAHLAGRLGCESNRRIRLTWENAHEASTTSLASVRTHTLQTLPLPSRNGLAPQLAEHRHAKPVRLPGSTPIL